jgi:RES domain-containing protein
VTGARPDDVTAWRLVKTRHAATAFDGEGARRYGGRWNSPAVRVAYAAETESLAVLEVLVHLQASELLASYSLVAVTFPSTLVETLDVTALPPDWSVSPPPASGQALGDAWIARATSAVLRVPSVIVATEGNYLINPAHPDFAQARVGTAQRFAFDARLVR